MKTLEYYVSYKYLRTLGSSEIKGEGGCTIIWDDPLELDANDIPILASAIAKKLAMIDKDSPCAEYKCSNIKVTLVGTSF